MQTKTIKTQRTFRLRLSFWQYLLIFTSLALIISSILTLITPEEEKIVFQNDSFTANYDQTQSTFKKISFSGVSPVLPEFFKIYAASDKSTTAEIIANQIINEKDMIPHQSVLNYWLGNNAQLAKSTYENNYTYVEVSDLEKNDLFILKPEAIQTCLNFYTKYSAGLALIPQEKSIEFLNNEEEQEITVENEAHILQIPLTYELDGFPVFYTNESEYPFICKINNKYDLERVVFKNFFHKFEPSLKLPPLNINQAINNIKNGIVSVISAESQIVEIIDLNWINEANLYSAEIEYRYDDKLKLAYPFYRFSGKLTNSAGLNIQASLITPAVAVSKEK